MSDLQARTLDAAFAVPCSASHRSHAIAHNPRRDCAEEGSQEGGEKGSHSQGPGEEALLSCSDTGLVVSIRTLSHFDFPHLCQRLGIDMLSRISRLVSKG